MAQNNKVREQQANLVPLLASSQSQQPATPNAPYFQSPVFKGFPQQCKQNIIHPSSFLLTEFHTVQKHYNNEVNQQNQLELNINENEIDEKECDKSRENKQLVSDLKKRIEILGEEISELNLQIKKKNQIIEDSKLQNIELLQTNQKQQTEIIRLNQIIQSYETTIKHHIEINQQTHKQIAQYQQELLKLKQDNNNLNKFITSTSSISKSPLNDNQDFCQKFKELIQKVNLEQLKGQELDAYKLNTKEYQKEMEIKEKEEIQKLFPVNDEKIAFREIQIKMKQLIEENEKLNEAFVEKSLEVEILRQQISS